MPNVVSAIPFYFLVDVAPTGESAEPEMIALVHSVQMMNKLDHLEAHHENGASASAGAGV